MDKIEALGNTISQISLYDLKSYYNQAKAVVLNYTEMEAKVRDATNDDPWGASSTLMQEIAQGTFNFQQFNEIMPTIYKRFTEKEAREWRQIYKALQLLEYLIKHGSERVIDDARSHISMIKILRNFHYVDDKGKDQGLNVRNRAKEIAELLSDLDRVRQERRKAKASKNKYTGVGNDGASFTSSTGSRYGRFGSDAGGFSGGFHNESNEDWHTGSSNTRDRYNGGGSSFKQNDDFEEYDAGEWEDRSTSKSNANRPRGGSTSVLAKKSPEKATPPPKAKEVDLLSMGDEDDIVAPPPHSDSSKAALSQSLGLDDDFDDFQTAPSANTASKAPASYPTAPKPNVFALLQATAPPNSTQAPSENLIGNMTFSSPATQQGTQPISANMNLFNSSMLQPMVINSASNNPQAPRPTQLGNPTALSHNKAGGNQSTATASKANGGDQFDDLFSFAGLTKPGNPTNSNITNPKAAKSTLSMAAMAREQSSASIWGVSGTAGAGTNSKPAAMGLPMSSGGSTSMSNNDDLLL
ncbi:hypothetical protein O181_069604 [Austropuccinia psidii MF-1]|uniref:ENTH domain-containing protein n=1 Tax=Austropuccinia psidii MF-1 TaxID=1389203 RepID=A0A9Q3EZ64_9BASI|nr:hypothetical protein [Austropuccinia psidii MF-1]